MADSALVDVLDACDQLVKDANCSFFVEALVLHDIVKQFPVDAVLHNEVQLRLRLDDLNTHRMRPYLVDLPRRAG